MVGEILAGLLPEDCTAQVDAVDIADASLRWSLQNPEYYIKPKEEWPESCKAGRVMCSAEVWRQLAQILYDRGFLRCVSDADVPRAANGDFVTNEMFGVTKRGQIPEGLAQVCRLIVNLKNSNDIMYCIISDLFELPTGYSWELVTLDDGEMVRS